MNQEQEKDLYDWGSDSSGVNTENRTEPPTHLKL